MDFTLLFLLLANTAFSLPSIISIQSSSFHSLTNSSAVAPSLTPSSGYVSTAKSTGPATTLPGVSLSTPRTSVSSSSSPVAIHSFTESESSSYSSTQVPQTLSSLTDTWTTRSTPSGVIYLSSSSKSSSVSESTFVTPRTSTGRATTLPQSSSASKQSRSSSTSPSSPSPSSFSSSTSPSPPSSSSSGGNTWSITTTHSTTPFPVYYTPTVTDTGGAAETSQAVQFIHLFHALYDNRQVISDPERKDDYITNVKNIKSEVEGFVEGLSVKPPSDIGCSSTAAKKRSKISKRDLTSVISGLAGNIGSLLLCADQVLDNIESVIGEDDLLISEFESLTDALNKIGDELQDTNDNRTTTLSQMTPSETSVSHSSSHSGSSSTTSKSSASSSSSSCSLETALQTSILCVPSTMTTGSAIVSTTTCSPLTTITTTGCSVTGWATTISSYASTTVCASDSCGTLCPMNSGPLSVSATSTIARTQYCASVVTITTSIMPTASNFALSSSIDTTLIAKPTAANPTKRNFSNYPETFDNTTLDHVSLDKRALPPVTAPLDETYVTSLEPRWISQAGNAAATWYDFPLNINGFFIPKGVNGLYGCSSVVIISERGVYISHIWEVPVFIDLKENPTSDDFFKQNTFTALYDGSTTSESIHNLIGTDGNPGPLHAAYSPQVYVFSPFIDDNSVTTSKWLKYQERAIWLGDQLRQAIPGAGNTGFAFGYRRTNSEDSVRQGVSYGKIIVEFDPFQGWLTTPEDPYLGRRVAMWRLWAQDQLIGQQSFLVPDEYSTTTHSKREGDAFGYPNPCNSSSPSTIPSRQPFTEFSTASATTSSFGSHSSIASAPTSITRSQSSTAQSSASRRVPTTASTRPSSVVTSLTSISRSNSSRIPSATPASISASTSSSSGIQSTTLTTTTTTSAPPITSSTITTSSASSYTSGPCNIHFYENLWANLNDADNDGSQIGVADYDSGTWYMVWSNMTATLTDANRKTIGYNESSMRYHETFFIDSELPWVMEIMKTEPTTDIFSILDLEASLVDYAYGSQKWTSGDSQCTLARSGGWDNNNPNDRNRQMDCKFDCPGK